MCGIIGYIGTKEAKDILMEGLEKLEYRGYDSAGITTIDENNTFVTHKSKGRLENLKSIVNKDNVKGKIGIGHTRWATHGEPSERNAHPHTDSEGKFYVVHNGIIENYRALREWLEKEGYTFYTQTDTEVIPNLIAHYYEGDFFKAVKQAMLRLEGSYAIAVLLAEQPDKIIAAKKDSPLIAAKTAEGCFIASDVPALLNHTDSVYYLEDYELVVLEKDNLTFYNTTGQQIEKQSNVIEWDADAAEKAGYPHFMLKEIFEQPKALHDTMAGRVAKGQPITLDGITFQKEDLQKMQRLYIIACGTAYHAGLVGKNLIERYARIPVEAMVASEFRYGNPILDENSIVIVLSQSGETADTLAAIRLAREHNSRVIAITNTVGSSIAREANEVLYNHAGPEIAVASTKAYITQLVCITMLAIKIAEAMGTVDSTEISCLVDELLALPQKVQLILDNQDVVQRFAAENYTVDDLFYVGRNLDYYVAMEGALKLKETSYIHTEAYAAGELKHGTMALIEEGVVALALMTQEHVLDKTRSNIDELLARGADVTVVTTEDVKLPGFEGAVCRIPKTLDVLAPVLAVVPLQLISYYITVHRGYDVDKPRNLAKAVTVE